jgi:hypothetical protein
MGKIKRKLKNKTAGVSEDNPAPKKTSGRPRGAAASTPKKRKPAKASTSDDDDEEPMPPAKKRSAATKKKVQEQEDDDEEIVMPKIKAEPMAHEDVSSFYSELQGAAFGEDDE